MSRSFFASTLANVLLHLVLELEVRVEEDSVHASKVTSVHIHILLLSEKVARIFLLSE